MTPQIQSLKADIQQVHAAGLELHRRGEDPFTVVRALADGVDAILRHLFLKVCGDAEDEVALLAVGGYGRRELCPHSDIDILFVRERNRAGERLERLVRMLWDGGFELGHAVRTPEECYAFMLDDLNTASALLESRYLAGSQRLHAHFLTRAVNRYSARRKGAFTAAKLGLLRQSIEDPRRTIYVIEPNLKEGVCGLRDVQRVLWIENMKHQGGTFEGLRREGRFSVDDVNRLEEAYGFYLRVRCDLHFTNGVRQDILERDSVPTIAVNLGYARTGDEQEAVEKLMGDYYRHARHVDRFLRYYLETGTRMRGLRRRVSRWLFSERVLPFLALHEGRLFFQGEPPPEAPQPEVILQVFEIAQEKDAVLSETVCEWVRRVLLKNDADLAHSAVVLQSFRKILKSGKNVGRLLKTLHETGVLGRILPEFARLDCLVNFDGHHQFTVDEHTLKTLQELDQIENDPAYPEPEFRRVYAQIQDRLPLRIALLLHDIGKALPGKHAVSGTETAILICERLGLDEESIETIEFLIYRHLELFRVSERRDLSEEGVIEALARLVENEERLDMLYLLTYIDIVSVGPGTWTRWKGAQLQEVYQRTAIQLRAGAAPAGGSLEAALEAAGLDEESRRKLLVHCEQMGTPGYARETLPEKMLFHVQLVERFLATREVQVALETFLGYHEISFCGGDRPRLFADLTGVLFSEGLNVLGARIFSRADGVVLDVFQVEVADTVQVSVEDRVERIRRKLRKIEASQQNVDDFIRERARFYRHRRWRKPLYGPSVAFDDEVSGRSTVIEVSAGDRPGLLYDLAVGFHRLGLDLRTAKVSTLADRAHDAFYVVERDGKKVDNAARRHEIAQALVAQAQSSTAGPRAEG